MLDGMPRVVPPAPISPATAVGAVHLTVSDVERSAAFYERAIGLRVLEHAGATARLGSGDAELLVLVEEPGAGAAPRNTGLFHFALRVPDRESLARWLAHAARDRVLLTGLSDHSVSEAIYLNDPDLHGIEIYRDRPREGWQVPEGGELQMGTLPLDVQDLLGALGDPAGAEWAGLPPGTDMGHVHLQVAAVPEAVAFYHEVLGFDLTTRYGTQAAFLGAAGYHHHVGANTWRSAGAPPPPPGAAALRHATIVLPDPGERDRVAGRVADAGQEPEPYDGGVMVRDPSANRLLLTA
jgi:catechol 2,3-dioxygenase